MAPIPSKPNIVGSGTALVDSGPAISASGVLPNPLAVN
jgi:hypothetical protein